MFDCMVKLINPRQERHADDTKGPLRPLFVSDRMEFCLNGRPLFVSDRMEFCLNGMETPTPILRRSICHLR